MGTSSARALLLLLAACSAAQAREAAAPQECQNAAQQPAIAAAKAALDGQPDDLAMRFKLADAWNDAGCFNEVLQVLQAGEPLHPHSSELQERLRTARSMLSEQSYFANLDRAAEEAKFSRATLRCSKLFDLDACDEALNLKPGNADVWFAKADALLQLNRPADAIVLYRRVAGLPHSKEALNARQAAAEVQRQGFLNACETKSGDAGVQACRSAMLPGASDEFDVLKHEGLLLQQQNQLPAALDAYVAAARLKRDDRAVALAVIALSESIGRTDTLTLAARGSALLTTGRPAEAVTALREAQRLAPGMADIKVQLASAERLAAAEASHRQARLAAAATVADGQRTGAETEPLTQLAPPQSASPERRYSNNAPATQTN